MRGRRTTGLYHGECVALGMLPMIEDPALVKRVRAVYRTLGLPTRAGANREKVLAYMQHDKKASGSSITVIKCPGLGCWRADKLPMTEDVYKRQGRRCCGRSGRVLRRQLYARH